MSSRKSPGGSMFPYPYKGGELFGLHLGSFGSDEKGVLERMHAEEIFFLEQKKCIPIWIDFCQTRLTGSVMSEFVTMLEHTHDLVIKLGLVGCSTLDRRRLKLAISKSPCLSGLPVRYFSDPEEAKTWLVSELA